MESYIVYCKNGNSYTGIALLCGKRNELEYYLRLAGSVSGDIVANINVYQLLIFMVRIESRRGESERWLQPIYSGSVTSFLSF